MSSAIPGTFRRRPVPERSRERRTAAEPPEPAAGGRSPGRPKTPADERPGDDEDGPAPCRAFRPGAPFPPFPAARKTRRAPPPVLPGRVAGGIREGESQWNPGGPAGGAGRGRPNARNGAPPGRREERRGRAGRDGRNDAVSTATPAGGERSLLPASAAGRTGGASRGRRTGDAEPGRRTGSPNPEGRSSAECGRAGPGGRRAGFPTSGTAGPPGGPAGRRAEGRGREFVPVPGSSFRFRGSFGAGPPSVQGLGGRGSGTPGFVSMVRRRESSGISRQRRKRRRTSGRAGGSAVTGRPNPGGVRANRPRGESAGFPHCRDGREGGTEPGRRRVGGFFPARGVRSGSGRFVRCGISFGFRGSGVRDSGVRNFGHQV